MPNDLPHSALARERRATAIHAEFQRPKLHAQVQTFNFVPRPERQVSSMVLGFILAESLGASWLPVAIERNY